MGEEDIHAVVQELQCVVRDLRMGIDNTCRNVEERLENIGKRTRVDIEGTPDGDMLLTHNSFTRYSTGTQCTNTVKDDDTTECKLNEMGEMKEKGARKIERAASSSKMEVKSTESTAPARITPEPDVVPAVHAGVGCNACQVCSFPQV